MSEFKHLSKVSQLEAEQLLDKVVFVPDYANRRILEKRVTSYKLTLDEGEYFLYDEHGVIISWQELTIEEAYDKLVSHFEKKVDCAMAELQEVTELEGTLKEDEINQQDMMQEIAHSEGYY